MQQTIVFVHGAWHGAWCWQEHFAPFFEKHHYKTISFDLLGHEKAGKADGINKYSISDYTNQLKAVVTNLEEEPIIIAHSMGGLLLQKFLETHKCRAAIYLTPVPKHGVINTVLRFLKKPYLYSALFNLNLYKLINSLKKANYAFFSSDFEANLLKSYSDKLGSESFRAFLNMLRPNIRLNYHRKTPSLVIAAEKDNIFLSKEIKKTANFLNADFILIKDIAHDVMLDTLHTNCSQEILSWLTKLKN